jgi:acetyl-CoA carboxylase biotin carboxyl carrier protein
MANQTISSPLPGTFYRSPNVGEPPFVSEGDRVSVGDTVGLVEVMKTFYEITADAEGTVERFLVDSGDPVDIGQAVVDLSD